MTMNNKAFKYIGIALIALLTISCEDFLTQEPPLQTTNELALSSFEGLVAATYGAYTPLYSANWYGRGFIVTSDLKGGNSKASPINTGRFRYDYTWKNNSSYTSNLWTPAYQAINRANNVLEHADLLDDPEVSQSEIDQLKGENLFIRALSHFDLVRMYAQPYSYAPQSPGIPVMLRSELSYPARDTVEKVYNQIVSDLEQAVKLLKVTSRNSGSNGSDAAVANKYSATALLAKVSLYMENWQDAADYAKDVIQAGYTLYDEISYESAWGQNAASEVIFEVFGKDGQGYYPGFDEIGYIYEPDGYGDVCATDDLLSLFEACDVRADVFKGHPDYPGYSWPAKYPGKAHIRENNIPVLRLAEMYLIRAEATLNGATGYDALVDYNQIRTHRGLNAAADVSLENIYDERRRELCFEGNQLWDLSRTGRGLDRDESEILISETDNIDIDFPDYRWAMPIPQRETEVNTNLEPNPTSN